MGLSHGFKLKITFEQEEVIILLQFNLISGFGCRKSRSMHLNICTSKVMLEYIYKIDTLNNCHWTRSYQKASTSVQLPATMVWHDSPYNSSAFPSYFRSWQLQSDQSPVICNIYDFFFSLSRDQRQILLNLPRVWRGVRATGRYWISLKVWNRSVDHHRFSGDVRCSYIESILCIEYRA